MKKGLIVLITLSVLMLISVFSISRSNGLPERFPAPDFILKDIFTGEDITLSDYKGRPVILYFFASW